MGFSGILFETLVACDGNPVLGQPLPTSLKFIKKTKQKNFNDKQQLL